MKRALDTETFVVLGEGLAAGVGHFSLTDDVQESSFPALVAEKLDTPFEQPLVQPPGVGDVGFQPLPAVVPNLNQTTALKEFPRNDADLGNLSVPGLRVAEAARRRPRTPLVQSDDPKQTLVNLILGMPGLTRSDGELPTQLEYAKARRPTLALVALGYQEVLEPLATGHVHDAEPVDLASFGDDYARILAELGGETTTVVAATIPNPLDTACFSSLETAAKILRTEVDFLKTRYGLADSDLIDLEGLIGIGYEFTARQISQQLPEGSVVSAAEAEKVSRGVAALNAKITALAEERGALVFDLHGFLAGVARDGIDAGGKELTAEYLGGFYLLNGVYPGRTGHALIANELLALLNDHFGRSYSPVDVQAVRVKDGNTLSQLADSGTFTDEFLEPRTADELPPLPAPDPSLLNVVPPFDPEKFNLFPIQTTYPFPPFDFGGQKEAAGCEPAAGIPAGGLSDPKLATPLKLPEGLEQTLTLNKSGSYFGDALRVVEYPDERPFLPGLPSFGASGNTFFGGLLMTDSHVAGKLHVRFSEPDANNVTRFEITQPGGLVGDDGVLAGPKLFKMPSQLNRVFDVPGLVSTGELNLSTGIVKNFLYCAYFLNSPILTLFGVNPNLPGPFPFVFPGPPNGGSTWARFEQREDGKLDLTLAANLFLPLGTGVGGEPTRLPLPFATPDLRCASIAARGTTLHPHIHLTTKESQDEEREHPPAIPVNTIREFVPFVRKTNFGDVFDLAIEELGGEGTGRSHLMGRLQVQFGPRFGDSVPIAVSFLPPGGLLSKDPEPLPYLPPGTSRGMVGFNEQMVFPSGKIYHQSELSSSMDPMNPPLGAINLKTGWVVGELLCRCFVVQKLFINLGKIEPCTPADSFLYQGPARLDTGPGGELVLALNGEVFIPYPQGFNFPSPSEDGNPPYKVTEESRLDPFLRFEAMVGGAPATNVLTSGANKAWIKETSSIAQEFSYRYSVPCDPAKSDKAFFEYTNHSEGDATFKLTRLSWLRASRSRDSEAGPDEADVVTFGGFGSWTGDSDLHQVSVHISIAPDGPYVGIQVDGGTTSNVNTKPKDIDETIPLENE
ncbi:MAG: hypothetical protein GY856_04430 [bacterium]|nr:hypothetical protein [bacterium]